MNFEKLFNSIESIQAKDRVDSEINKLAKEFQKASDRMQARKEEFRKDARRGSRTTDQRFSL